MADFDSFSDIKSWLLSLGDFQATGDDFDAEVGSAIVRAWEDLHARHPWWWATKFPNGAFVTTADITNRTLTISSTGTSVTGTLSSTVSTDLDNYKIKPSGKNWAARITAHTAGSANVTLDAVPETIAAGTACVIFQDEYQLASDLQHFVDGLHRGDGHFVESWTMERLVAEYPDPPSGGDSPVAFARINQRRIRLSHYPQNVYRYEYPYTALLDKPSGSGDLAIDRNWRHLLADGAAFFAFLFKSDKRAEIFKREYERGIEQAIIFHQRMMAGLGTRQGGRTVGPYA